MLQGLQLLCQLEGEALQTILGESMFQKGSQEGVVYILSTSWELAEAVQESARLNIYQLNVETESYYSFSKEILHKCYLFVSMSQKPYKPFESLLSFTKKITQSVIIQSS